MIAANDAWYDPIRAIIKAEHLNISAIG
jgi:hypothetical protein